MLKRKPPSYKHNISGTDIRKARTTLGLSQDDFAALLGYRYTSTAVSRLEANGARLSGTRARLLRTLMLIHKHRKILPEALTENLFVKKNSMTREEFTYLRTMLNLSQNDLAWILRFKGSQMIAYLEGGTFSITKKTAQALWTLAEKSIKKFVVLDGFHPLSDHELSKIKGELGISWTKMAACLGMNAIGVSSTKKRHELGRSQSKMLRILLLLSRNKSSLPRELAIMIPYKKLTSTRLKQIRIALGMDQSQFAKATGECSSTSISAMEQNHRKVTERISKEAERLEREMKPND